MITVKTKEQIEEMRKASIIVRDTLDLLCEKAKEGISTFELDRIAYEYIISQGAKPSFLNYHGFPASICTSVNDVVVHGIPSKKMILKEGDIISFDVGAVKNGWHGDAARTIGIGRIDSYAQQLIDVTKQCFFQAVKRIRPSVRLGDIGEAVQSYAESFGYGVVREMVGHGIGREMHEEPDVPNYGIKGRGIRLQAGMVIAIEPMINAGGKEITFDTDGWTVRTYDGSLSAHYENTVAVTEEGYDILSL
jgi:methionyl aminopeptidase